MAFPSATMSPGSSVITLNYERTFPMESHFLCRSALPLDAVYPRHDGKWSDSSGGDATGRAGAGSTVEPFARVQLAVLSLKVARVTSSPRARRRLRPRRRPRSRA